MKRFDLSRLIVVKQAKKFGSVSFDLIATDFELTSLARELLRSKLVNFVIYCQKKGHPRTTIYCGSQYVEISKILLKHLPSVMGLFKDFLRNPNNFQNRREFKDV